MAALPRRWIKSHLNNILNFEHDMKRRSAGIPYLVLAVLSGPDFDACNVPYVFNQLFEYLGVETVQFDATKSHVINTLRVLYMDSKLSSATKPFIEKGFIVAVKGFGSMKCGQDNFTISMYR